MAEQKLTEVKIRTENLDKNFPNFQQPKIRGYFSVNKSREFVPDSSQLKYFYSTHLKNKSLYFDLNKGIEKCVKKPENLDEKLDFLLHFLCRNLQHFYDDNCKV